MAYLEILDFIDVGSGGDHNATSWYISKEKNITNSKDFNKELLVDFSIKDLFNVKKWHSPLPKLPKDGEGFYTDETELYGYVELWVNDYKSDLFFLGCVNQTAYDTLYTIDKKTHHLIKYEDLHPKSKESWIVKENTYCSEWEDYMP